MTASIPKENTIGLAIPRLDGRLKVTGQATYVADVSLPGCLWAAILRSPLPHARIVAIDTSRVRQLDGVETVLTGQDLPGARFGRAIADIPILCDDRVRYIGDPVAAVAARDRETAEAATHLIDVEYESLPAVFEPEQAMMRSAPRLHPAFAEYRRDRLPPGVHATALPEIPNLCSFQHVEQGDLDAGFRAADLVYEHTYKTPVQHQAYIEPHGCLVWAQPHGLVRVWASTKSPYVLRGLLARDLGLEPERIIIEPVYVGGDFGGKGSPMHVPLAYHLSKAAGRPVRVVLSSSEDFQAANPRHAASITVRTGLKRDGTMLARSVRAVFTSGAYAGYRPMANAELAGGHYVHGAYRIPNHCFESLIAYTNTVPGGHMRAPGGVQTVFACEVEMDRIARDMGIDPFELRRSNAVRPGDAGIEGERWASTRLEECLDAVREASGWDGPCPPNTGRGLAVCQSPIGPGASTVRIVVQDSTTAAVFTSVFDQGSGSHTILAQIVAAELDLAIEKVRIEMLGTDSGLWDRGSSASSVTHGAGRAALQATQDIRGRLTRGESYPLEAEARYEDWRQPDTTSFLAQVVETVVDPETGQARIQKVTGAYDVGTVINLASVTGQIDGGLLMGLGAAMTEDLRVVDGRVESPGLHEYKIPTMADVPEHQTILITDDPGPGPYGAKQVSELSNVALPAACANALAAAVGGVFDQLPLTAERVLAISRSRRP